MTNYAIFYVGGKAPESPEAGAAMMAAWMKWMADLGDSVVNPGSPLKFVQSVSNGAASAINWDNKPSGYSVFKAESIEQVVEMCKGCPQSEEMQINIAEIMNLPS